MATDDHNLMWCVVSETVENVGIAPIPLFMGLDEAA